MPIGEYENFQDCKDKNKDKKNPEAYCGSIQNQVEGKNNNDSRLYKSVFILPLIKSYKDSEKKQHIAAYISSTLRDRDGDRFDKTVLEYWAKLINAGKINLGQDHGHSWKDTMGVWKHAELRHNPNGDDIHQAKWYLYADAVLEDPDINKDSGLLIHKSDIGEQISLSIAANPAAKNWYDLETEQDGSTTRVIKSAELLQADIVSEPANPDARSLGVFLKHLKETGCGEDCIVCQFDNCVKKSMIAPNTKIEQSVSSLVTENTNKTKMTETVKKSQEELNKEHGCKEGEKYCDKEGKCMPMDEEKKSQLSPEVEKFIETLKAIATTPAPLEDADVGADKYGDNKAGGLEGIVARTLAAMRANPTMGDLQFNIPSAINMAVPGVSGSSGAKPMTTNTPATPNLDTGIPIPPATVPASPGLSGAGPQPAQSQGVPVTPDLRNPAPMPPAQVQASTPEPKIVKENVKKLPRSVLLNEKRTMEYIEKARSGVTPKQESPGEILPNLIDTKKLEGDIRKHAEAYNAEIRKIHTSQVKQQYTANDLVKMAEEGKLYTNLDPDGNMEKVVKTIANSGKTNKAVSTLLLKYK